MVLLFLIYTESGNRRVIYLYTQSHDNVTNSKINWFIQIPKSLPIRKIVSPNSIPKNLFPKYYPDRSLFPEGSSTFIMYHHLIELKEYL